MLALWPLRPMIIIVIVLVCPYGLPKRLTGMVLLLKQISRHQGLGPLKGQQVDLLCKRRPFDLF